MDGSNGTNGHGRRLDLGRDPLLDTQQDMVPPHLEDEDSDALITLTSGPNTRLANSGRGAPSSFAPPPAIVPAKQIPAPSSTAARGKPAALRVVTTPPAPPADEVMAVQSWVNEPSSAAIPVAAMAAMAQPVTVRAPTVVTPPPIPVAAMPQPPAAQRDTSLAVPGLPVNHERLAEHLLHPDNADLLVRIFQHSINAAADERHGDIEGWKRAAQAAVQKVFADKIVELEQANLDLVSATEQLAQGDLHARDLIHRGELMQTRVEALTAQVSEANVALRAAEVANVGYTDQVQALLAKIESADRVIVTLNGKLQLLERNIGQAEGHAAAALSAAKQARSERPYKNGIKPLYVWIGGAAIAIIMVLMGIVIVKSENDGNVAPVAQIAAKAPTPVAAPKAETPVAKAIEAPAPVAPAPATVAAKKEAPTPMSDQTFDIEAAEKPSPSADGRWHLTSKGRNWACSKLVWNTSTKIGKLSACQ